MNLRRSDLKLIDLNLGYLLLKIFFPFIISEGGAV